MKTIKNLLLGIFVLSIMFTSKLYSQEAKTEEFKPVYMVVTTVHRSSDPNVDFSDWMKTEKEYFDKVTMKNDLILGYGVYFHYFTPDDSEVKLVTIYKNWEDINNAAEVTNKLIDEAWPNEEGRNSFFEKQSSYYTNHHSDEIYMTTRFSKPTKLDGDKPLIFYVKVNKRGSRGGSGWNEYFENVTMKNNYIKGYYTHVHRWGADSNDMIEAFAFESLGDIEKSFEEEGRLVNEHWSDADKRKEFFKGYDKLFAGHGDYIYSNVPELVK